MRLRWKRRFSLNKFDDDVSSLWRRQSHTLSVDGAISSPKDVLDVVISVIFACVRYACVDDMIIVCLSLTAAFDAPRAVAAATSMSDCSRVSIRYIRNTSSLYQLAVAPSLSDEHCNVYWQFFLCTLFEPDRRDGSEAVSDKENYSFQS
jgi:hypothetical protein